MTKNDYVGYFDYAAATPMLDEVVTVMEPYFSLEFYNPSAIYKSAIVVKREYNSAIHSIAVELGCKPRECIITAGGTEANNLAIRGILDRYPNANAVLSSVEHDSITKPAKRYEHRLVAVDNKGKIIVTDLANKIDDQTVLVTIQYANNEVGTVQPIKKIVEIIDNIRQDRHKRGILTPLYFHTDACQAVNYCDINTSRLGIDMMTINSGKIYGPKQCGLLYVRTGLELNPLILGGGQNFGYRSGTENVSSAIGFAKAIQIVRGDSKQEISRLAKLQDMFFKSFKNRLIINGPIGKNRLVNNIHITLPEFDNERLVMELDEKGFMTATGSACSASKGTPSSVLSAMGMSDTDSKSSLRITMGRFTTTEDCERLIKQIIAIAKI